MHCLYSRLCHTHFYITAHTHLNATPLTIVIHFTPHLKVSIIGMVTYTREPCLLEVDQHTGSTFHQPYISHVLVHSSCQLFTVIRDGINSFDVSPPPTSLPYSTQLLTTNFVTSAKDVVKQTFSLFLLCRANLGQKTVVDLTWQQNL